jgi:hypothetical protein
MHHCKTACATLLASFVFTLFLGRAHAQTTAAPTDSRVFELRTYTTEPGRLAALEARFRDRTTKLFEKHGMTNIGYWTPVDEPRSENTLVYLLAHESRAAAKQSWEAFINDPEWHQARDASEKDGPIVSKVDSVYLTPTDFSTLR